MSQPRPPNNTWPAVVALGMLLAFLCFLIWIIVTA